MKHQPAARSDLGRASIIKIIHAAHHLCAASQQKFVLYPWYLNNGSTDHIAFDHESCIPQMSDLQKNYAHCVTSNYVKQESQPIWLRGWTIGKNCVDGQKT